MQILVNEPTLTDLIKLSGKRLEDLAGELEQATGKRRSISAISLAGKRGTNDYSLIKALAVALGRDEVEVVAAAAASKKVFTNS